MPKLECNVKGVVGDMDKENLKEVTVIEKARETFIITLVGLKIFSKK